eukprot:1229789-Alexandrium_andersonii.AAC.1
MTRPVPDLTDDGSVSSLDSDYNNSSGGANDNGNRSATELRSLGNDNMEDVTPMGTEQNGDTPNPSMKRRSTNSSPRTLPRLTRLEESQAGLRRQGSARIPLSQAVR